MFDDFKQIPIPICYFLKPTAMSKRHETIPNEPEESPAQPGKPEVEPPRDPKTPDIPREAPQHEPREVPQQPAPTPEIKPDGAGSLLNRTEV